MTESQSPIQKWDPANDGIDHINLYTKGNTLLGKMGSNLYPIPVLHPTHGLFACLESGWYWYATGMKHDELKELPGFDAKNRGRKLEQIHNPRFKEMIKELLRLKFTQCLALKNALAESTLPLAHYYVYEGKPQYQDKHYWQIEYLEQLRHEFQME